MKGPPLAAVQLVHPFPTHLFFFLEKERQATNLAVSLAWRGLLREFRIDASGKWMMGKVQ